MNEELKIKTFIRWNKDELESVRVSYLAKEENNSTLLKQIYLQHPELRSFREAKPTGEKCEKCGSDMLDYGLKNTTKGIIHLFRCDNEECRNVKHEIEYTPEEVEILKKINEPKMCCDKKMKDDWIFCPYCGKMIT